MKLLSASLLGLSVFALGSTACVVSDDAGQETTGETFATAETNDSTMTNATSTTTTATATTPDTEDDDGDTSTTTDDTVGPEDTTTTVDPTTTTGSGIPTVVMETTLGTITIELDDEAAPITVENFLAYVDSGFYDGSDGMGSTTFHRVIPGFVIQGGGLLENQQVKTGTLPPIVNEFGNGLINDRGSIAMARTEDPDSATSQFYFNLVDNPLLDNPPGYAVFGRITEGLEVMDAIGAVSTDGFDVPLDPVLITSVSLQ